MKVQKVFIFLLFIFSTNLLPNLALAWPWDEKEKDPKIIKQQELDKISHQLQNARDKLQRLIAKRWQKKQSYVNRRETDKEQLASLREIQERAYNEQSRIKEEVFAQEKTIEDTKEKTNEIKEGWRVVGLTYEEILEKEAELIPASFPLDVEKRRLKLEKVRNASTAEGVIQGFDAYMDFFYHFILKGSKISLQKETILPENGLPVDVNVARFGSVLGYGINEKNQSWLISQTGRLGASRFSVDSITSPILKSFLNDSFPKWITSANVFGNVIIDIIQNASSKNLISGKQIGKIERIKHYLKKGGVVMIPLLALFGWALYLMIYKFIQLNILRKLNIKESKKVIYHLENTQIDNAIDLIQKMKGPIAKVIATCLDYDKKERDQAEKAVKEVMIKEVPGLNRHLNTLAVIAGAAPLLGLLGTVTGMISLFDVITNYGTGDPKIMASGISEALITTQTGLVVAIPILLIYNSLRNRKNRLLEEMQKNAMIILNRIWPGGVT